MSMSNPTLMSRRGLVLAAGLALLCSVRPVGAQFGTATISTNCFRDGIKDTADGAIVCVPPAAPTQVGDDFVAADWRLNVNADVGAFAGVGVYRQGGGEFTLSVPVTSQVAYKLTFFVTVLGGLSIHQDSPNACKFDSVVASLSTVKARFYDERLDGGFVDLPFDNLPAPLRLDKQGGSVTFEYDRHAVNNVAPSLPGKPQRWDLVVHLELKADSEGCETSARFGASQGSTTGCGACGYPGNPPRDAALDGVFLSAVYESACGDGVVQQSEECDPMVQTNGCCSDQCRWQPSTQPCSDRLFCNGADQCGTNGACDIHAGDPCPGANGVGSCAESCDEATDSCTAPDPDLSPCEGGDGVSCTIERCFGGQCRLYRDACAVRSECAGDCDDDLRVTATDLLAGRYVAGIDPDLYCAALDADSDGVITNSDLLATIHAIFRGCRCADLREDCGPQSGVLTTVCGPGVQDVPRNSSFVALGSGVKAAFLTHCRTQEERQVTTDANLCTLRGSVHQGVLFGWDSYLCKVELVTGSPVLVAEATYGGNCGASLGNVNAAVAESCNGRGPCLYRVDTAVLGDPVPNCAKDFEVKYLCDDGLARSARAEPEANGKTVTLDCD